MKRKISVRISQELAERLEAASALAGATKASIIEAAIDRFIESGAETSNDTLLAHLFRINRRLIEIESDLRIVAETVALHVRYHLTITPAVPAVDQHDACALGHNRFEEFAAQAARRVHLNMPLMKETMNRAVATRPNLFAHGSGQGAQPFGTSTANAVEGAARNGQQKELASEREQ